MPLRAVWLAGICFCVACADYTPKPQGYFRIDLPAPAYIALAVEELPYSFNIASLATPELLPAGEAESRINVRYPSLGATIYCSYLPVNSFTLEAAMNESRALVFRQSRNVRKITGQSYDHPAERVYATLYRLDDESASPVQFMLTDSVSRFFRGALLYDCAPNADSLAPVTRYLQADIMELIQSFRWK